MHTIAVKAEDTRCFTYSPGALSAGSPGGHKISRAGTSCGSPWFDVRRPAGQHEQPDPGVHEADGWALPTEDDHPAEHWLFARSPYVRGVSRR